MSLNWRDDKIPLVVVTWNPEQVVKDQLVMTVRTKRRAGSTFFLSFRSKFAAVRALTESCYCADLAGDQLFECTVGPRKNNFVFCLLMAFERWICVRNLAPPPLNINNKKLPFRAYEANK